MLVDQSAKHVFPPYWRARSDHDGCSFPGVWRAPAEATMGPLGSVVVDVLQRAPSPGACDHR